MIFFINFIFCYDLGIHLSQTGTEDRLVEGAVVRWLVSVILFPICNQFPHSFLLWLGLHLWWFRHRFQIYPSFCKHPFDGLMDVPSSCVWVCVCASRVVKPSRIFTELFLCFIIRWEEMHDEAIQNALRTSNMHSWTSLIGLWTELFLILSSVFKIRLLNDCFLLQWQLLWFLTSCSNTSFTLTEFGATGWNVDLFTRLILRDRWIGWRTLHEIRLHKLMLLNGLWFSSLLVRCWTGSFVF